MRPLSELGDMDMFFYHGQVELDVEIEHDIIAGLIQPKRSLYYNRQDGAGVHEYEGHPNTIALDVGLRYDIINWIARRNLTVGDGNSNTKDRRVLASQSAIKILREGQNIDIQVLYIPLFKADQPKIVGFPIGGSFNE